MLVNSYYCGICVVPKDVMFKLLWYCGICSVELFSICGIVVFVQLNCSIFLFAKMESVSAVCQLTTLQRPTDRRCTVLCDAQRLGAAKYSAAPVS